MASTSPRNKNLNNRPHALLTIAVLVITTGTSPADELLMSNGDHISGTVLSREGDSLKFKTPYAGMIKVRWSEIDA